MKLASFRHAGRDRIGIVRHDDEVAVVDGFTSMRDLIRSGEDPERFKARSALSTEEIDWRPPIPHPGKICCVAMNNSASNARKISAPDHPAFFLKPPSCLVGNGQTIHVRRYYGSVHPEPELGVVIGKKATVSSSNSPLCCLSSCSSSLLRLVDDFLGFLPAASVAPGPAMISST